jgi:hypothetical protein
MARVPINAEGEQKPSAKMAAPQEQLSCSL